MLDANVFNPWENDKAKLNKKTIKGFDMCE